MLHIPLLRKGKPYKSLDTVTTNHHRSGEPFVELSQANAGLIRRDLLDQKTSLDALAGFTHADMIAICERAAEIFAKDTLPLGDAEQSTDDYASQISATTGLPLVMARRNMDKIRTALAQTGEVIRGLTRNLDLAILDRGFGEIDGQALSFFPRSSSLAAVLPNNSPGVHSLWVPAVALKIPLVLKPGSSEPWTPYRIIQALIRAGCPAEMFSYYPTDHAGASEILRACGRGMLFGDANSTRAWRNDSRIELHGPGYSKVVIGGDWIDDFEKHLDLIVSSIVSNGGRSCVNASAVWVPRRGREVAEALAARLAAIEPRRWDDEQAQLAPFSNPDVARAISQMIDEGLEEPGAADLTAQHRKGSRGRGRIVEFDGGTYLLPTVVHCEDSDHSLANREFLFPYASVVEVDEAEWPERFGPTLVISALTEQPNLIARLAASPHIGRLNLGAIPTQQVRWDQPHEGNLFDHLYGRRAFQTALAATSG